MAGLDDVKGLFQPKWFTDLLLWFSDSLILFMISKVEQNKTKPPIKPQEGKKQT